MVHKPKLDCLGEYNVSTLKKTDIKKNKKRLIRKQQYLKHAQFISLNTESQSFVYVILIHPFAVQEHQSSQSQLLSNQVY